MTPGRLDGDERAGYGLGGGGEPPAPPALAPGLAVTWYPVERPLPEEIVRAADVVTLHTHADAGDVRLAARVRAIRPQARLWLALPANHFVRKPEATAVAGVRAAARIAVDLGAEALEINGEGASDPARPGDWTPADDAERARLTALAALLLDAVADVAPRLVRLWTSHDMPGFGLPWGAILSRALHSPQHYPAEAGRRVSLAELRGRVERSRGRWEDRAERGEIPADVVPYGMRWIPYGQGWGHVPAATCWLLDQAPLSRLWAAPGSWDEGGTTALRAMALIRIAAGHAPGAVARWQAAHGLAADGIVGPATLRALGLGP